MAFASHGGLSMRSPSQFGFRASEPINYCVRNDSKLPWPRAQAYTQMRLLSLSVSLSLDLSLSVSVSRFLSVFSFSEGPSSSMSLYVVQRVFSSCSLYPW